jgi:hypothetical protein
LGAEALRADLAGITGAVQARDQEPPAPRPTPPELVPSRLVGRLNRTAAAPRAGLATVGELQDRLDGLVGQMTASQAERSPEVGRTLEAASKRIEAMIGDLEQRHERRLEEFIERGERQRDALSRSLDLVHSRLDQLAEAAQPMLSGLEGLRDEHRRLTAQSADAAGAVAVMDQRSRQGQEDTTRVVLASLAGLAAMVGPGFESVDELRSSWDELVVRATALDGFPGALEDRLAETAAELRHKQDRQSVHVTAALASISEMLDQLGRRHEQQRAELFERVNRLGEELEDTSARLGRTADQMAEDARGQLTTIDLGLRVALTGIEGIVAERRGEQLAQVADAQHEIADSFLQGLSRFGQQVDAGLQHATEELTASVFHSQEESEHRNVAVQDAVTRALAQVEEAEFGRDKQLLDLRRLVDRLSTEVQLLRPAIDVRAGSDHGLDDVTLARLAGRVVALLSDQHFLGVEARAGSALELSSTATPPSRVNEWEHPHALILPSTGRRA